MRNYSFNIRAVALLILMIGMQVDAQGQDQDEAREDRQDGSGIDWGIAWRFGGIVGAGPVVHSTTMKSLPGIPSCCPGYDGGEGLTFAGGPSLEFSFTDRLAVNARLLVDRYSGTLETEEGAFVTAGRDTAEATFLHTIEESQYGVGVEWLLNFRIVEELRIMSGIRTGYMFTGSAHQEERIVAPSSIRYENDLRTRMVFDGELPQMNPVHLSLLAGFRYDLPLDPASTFLISPEIIFWNSLSNVVDEREWTMLGVRFGVTVFYNGYRRIEPSPLDPLGDD